ncbi:hypothetical protein K470DRAFT_218378 [Piedraia hortae CBS 480.64]|uniref:Amino acid permease/ SLC12A domain-containing protein n=1 Tax=Piedraia hortae CBS 480.64 TaxID=1314780 RepID=A0A6A7BYP7_9PEZI|nr:hypothetical protein K470DRAFT_218378 [Piedraia hortae CBS 480.64]
MNDEYGDIERQPSVGVDTSKPLKRRLQSRHLQMIAIGGTIGTGLFIGSAVALASSGPAGALIAYAFVGTLVYSVMVSLGEMATYIPISGAFTAYAARFVDPSLGFAMGWIYWFSWATTFAVELTASGLIIKYWAPELDSGIFIGSFWVAIFILNLFPVSFYGEIEFWFAMIKVIAVAGFFIFAICVNAGVGRQGYLGFHYWGHPGAFAPYLVKNDVSLAKFVGFWAVLIQAGFSYQGTELVAIAAGETCNPRKTVPSAIKKTFYRILFFFVGSIFFIGILIPYDNPDLLSGKSDASASPFVIAAKLAGVSTLPGLINAVLLSVVLSSANSNVYSGSRILVGLAGENCAPQFLTKSTGGGVPYVAVIVTAAVGLLGFMNESNNAGKVFTWLVSISGVSGFIAWGCVGISYLAFHRILKSRGIDRDTLPYTAPYQPWFTYYGIGFNIIIILTQGFTAFIPWNTSNFFVAYISLMLFVVMYIGHKLIYRTKLVKPEIADIDTGRIDLNEEEGANFGKEKKSGLMGKIRSFVG